MWLALEKSYSNHQPQHQNELNFRVPQEQAVVDALPALFADLSMDEYVGGDWKIKDFPNIDHSHNAGLDPALDVD